MSMTQEQRLLFLKFSRIDYSYQKLLRLLASEVELTDLLTASSHQLEQYAFSKKQQQLWLADEQQALDEDLDWLLQTENHLITIFDAQYPSLLKAIYDPPLALYVKGDPNLLSAMQVAMVGSRNPSHVGAETAFDFAKYLAQMNVLITSGLATGIDAASHQGALAAGGKTIAVCGTGLQRVYPAKHHALAKQIAANGALVSELPLQCGPKPYHFPKRNRIISGLSSGCLVVEAALRSGSLITAKQALEQGREVFAVPGSIHNPLARGCHHLIRQGAKLVETAADLFEELPALSQLSPLEAPVEMTANAPILDEAHQKLLECIGFESTAVDVIVAQSGLPVEQVSSMLLNLELNSMICQEFGGYTRNKG